MAAKGCKQKSTLLPNFEGEPLLRHFRALDEWWGGASPAPGAVDGQAFSAVWEGLYTPTVSGPTPFFLAANGHSRLYLNDMLVVENNNGDIITRLSVNYEFGSWWVGSIALASWPNLSPESGILLSN